MLKLDKEATKAARTKHANGVKRLRTLIRMDPEKGHVPPPGARWPVKSEHAHVVTSARMNGTRKHTPNRAARIRARKAQRAARRANR